MPSPESVHEIGTAVSGVSFQHRPAEDFAARQTKTSNVYVLGALWFAVLIAPLPFGSVTAWAWGVLAIITAGTLAAWSVLVLTNQLGVAVPIGKVAVPAVLYGLVIVWGLVQVAPFTPQSWHHPIWAEAAKSLGLPYSGRITLDPAETMAAIARFLWYGAIFWLALQLGRDKWNARTSIALMAWTGLAYAVYGLIVKFTGAESVLWVKKFIYHEEVTSTFINKNSYAGFASIGLICVSARLIDPLTSLPAHTSVKAEKYALVLNALLAKSWFLILAWAIILTAMILSDSRAGLVSGVIGLLAFLVALLLSKSVPSRVGRWFGVVMIAGIIGFFVFSGSSVDKRFAYVGEQTQGRLSIYETTLEMVRDASMLGMGLGTYPEIFQLYRRAGPEHRTPARKAHNTYLENAAELGIPATACLVAAIGAICIICLGGVRNRRRDMVIPAVGLGVTVALGLHSVVDFSLQIPGITASYAFVMGIACAQSWSGGRKRMDRQI
jgi:O-antigen ligase